MSCRFPSGVLVTGGAGFIGSELVRQLVSDGNAVAVLDNLTTGTLDNLASVPQDALRVVVGDVRDPAVVADAVRGASVVFHLACLGVRHSIHSPLENHDVNATGTLRLLEAARDRSVVRFVCVSSSEVYGTARWAPMDESHPTYPTTVYGASKLAGECYARAFHKTYTLPTVVVRPFNVFGPRCHHEGDSGEVIPRFMLRTMATRPMVVFGDGTQTRDFTFVADTARAIRLAAAADKAIGMTINIGSGLEVSINELAQTVASVVGGRAEVVYDDPRSGDVLRLIADTSTAGDVLVYLPATSLREGLTILRDWYAASGHSPRDLLAAESARNWIRPEGGAVGD